MRFLLSFLLLFCFNSFSNAQSNSSFLEAELIELEEHFKSRNAQNDEVSKVDVAWHLDHSLKVINEITASLESSNPEDFKNNINFIRGIVYSTGRMPRGVGKATKAVTPPDEIKDEDLHKQLALAKENLTLIFTLDKKVNMMHPVFGQLKRNKVIRFLKIHTRHHLRIIRDILEES